MVPDDKTGSTPDGSEATTPPERVETPGSAPGSKQADGGPNTDDPARHRHRHGVERVSAAAQPGWDLSNAGLAHAGGTVALPPAGHC